MFGHWTKKTNLTELVPSQNLLFEKKRAFLHQGEDLEGMSAQQYLLRFQHMDRITSAALGHMILILLSMQLRQTKYDGCS
jgi:hypothetical protein